MLALIAFDGASPAILDELFAEGALPNLRGLEESGSRLRLETHADRFPAGVYPSLWSGVPLERHGIHHPFMWHPKGQRVRDLSRFPYPAPMWERLSESGVKCVVVDAYEAPVPKAVNGLYLSGWQFRNRVVLRPAAVPAAARRRWERRFGRASPGEEVFGQASSRRLRQLATTLVRSPRRAADVAVAAVRELAPDLLVVGLPAVHIGGHQLWDPAVALPDAPEELGTELRGALRRIYREADDALGRIVDSLPKGADVIAFSALGMGPETSRHDSLGAMLSAVLDGRRSDGSSPGKSSGWDFRAALPAWLRAPVAQALPDRVAISLTAALELRRVDWRRTRAFVVPSDAIGYIRLNVRGREREGIVEPEEVDAVVEEIEQGLTEFRLPSGAPVISALERVRNVVPEGPGLALLPDLIVRWCDEPARPGEVLTSESFGSVRRGAGTGRTGNHTADAWAVVAPGRGRPRAADEPRITDLATTALGYFGVEHDGVELLERP